MIDLIKLVFFILSSSSSYRLFVRIKNLKNSISSLFAFKPQTKQQQQPKTNWLLYDKNKKKKDLFLFVYIDQLFLIIDVEERLRLSLIQKKIKLKGVL